MKLSHLVCALALCLPLAPAACRAATLVSVERSVLAFTFVDVFAVYTDSDAVGFESASTGPFLEAAVSASGLTDLANAFSEASQDSDVLVASGGFRVNGGGAVGVSFDVFDPGDPSRAEGIADSAVAIVFEVANPSTYSFGVALNAELAQVDLFSGTARADVLVASFVRLTGLSSGTVIDLAVVDGLDDGVVEVEARTLTGALAADTYLLEIGATASSRGFEDAVGFGTAGFGFDFLVVREPGAAMLFAIGLGGLALLSRARGR